MIKEQQKPHDQLPGDHAANDMPLDLREYHNDTLSLKHPSNRSKKDEQKSF